MMSERVRSVLQRIQSELAQWDSSKLLAFVKEEPPPWNGAERLELVRGLCERNIFLWLDYISAELRSLASLDTQYVDVLSEVVNKVRHDMAQGPIIHALIEVGENDPQLGIQLSSTMRKRGDEGLTIYSSFLLGGAGRKDLSGVKPAIEELLQSPDSVNQVVALRTYRVVFETAQEKIPKDIFSVMETRATSKQFDVRLEAINALLDFARLDEERSMKTLTAIAEEDSSLRGALASRLHLKGALSVKSTAALLQTIVQDEDERTLGQVVSVLASEGGKFQQEALDMIVSLVARGKYHKVYLLDYAAQEVGKADVNRAIKTVENALKTPHTANLNSYAPYLLVDMCKSDYATLADHLKPWLSDAQLRDVALRGARELLGLAFGTSNQVVADILLPALESDAKSMGIDIERLLKRDTDRIAQCIELLDEIRSGRKTLDYTEIERNWQSFPSLREFLGDRWLGEKKAEDNKSHEILYNLAYLSREAELEKVRSEPLSKLEPFQVFLRLLWIQDRLRPRVMLTYLEEMTMSVKDLPNNGALKNDLRLDDKFYAAFSELQMAHAFAKRKHLLRLAPTVGTKSLDLEVTLDSGPVLFEVINPMLFRQLKYAAGAMFIPNRARGKIYDEFKKHLAQRADAETRPAVIVIDIGRSEIDYDFVADYLYGTLQYTFWTDKKTGKLVGTAETRAKDSMHELGKASSENLDIISAVICYKTPLGDDGKFHMRGQIFLNPHAQNLLTDAQVSNIEEALFH